MGKGSNLSDSAGVGKLVMELVSRVEKSGPVLSLPWLMLMKTEMFWPKN